jgi:signal transduction histidine kinase
MVLQLLQNIIGNGIKYNQSTQPTVIIKHNLTDKGFEMLISDNGIGIPEHQREKVFEIFNRLHSSQEYSGSGIGLAICKKIVESMGGRIFIENNPAGGTVFRISLPASILVAQ